MLNNKGQSLILFILIIPILLGITALVIDVGNALYKKNELSSTIEFVLDYALDENNESENFNKRNLEELLSYNLPDCQTKIEKQNEVIVISSKTYVEGIFTNILNINGFPIESEYKGYWKETKKNIQKVK